MKYIIISKLTGDQVGGKFKTKANAEKECERMNKRGDFYRVVPA